VIRPDAVRRGRASPVTRTIVYTLCAGSLDGRRMYAKEIRDMATMLESCAPPSAVPRPIDPTNADNLNSCKLCGG